MSEALQDTHGVALPIGTGRAPWLPFFAKWIVTVTEFSLVQAGVQALGAVAGFLIVRSLSKPEFAFYVIVNSMQTATNSLADFGVGIGIRSIGGRVWNDPDRFGQLLATVIHLRKRFAILSLSVCLPISAWMLWRNGASLLTLSGLCLTIALGLFPLLGITAWATSAQLHGEYRRLQKLDLWNAIVRVGLIGALALSSISAFLVAFVGALGNWIQALVLKRWAKEKVTPQTSPNSDYRKELASLSLKRMPNVIFFCLQGQITLLILTFLGNVSGIADISALARLATLLTIFSVTFGNVLAPRFARCHDSARLRQLYLLLLGGTVLVLLPFLTLSWASPSTLLGLLGSKYQNLDAECVWVVASVCAGQVCGVMWSLNSSKAWIRFQSWGFIPIILAVQVLAAITLDLHRFHAVVLFNLAGACAPLPLYVADAWHGLRTCAKKACHDIA
jgi:O-antigen/teichoic acid export membrane protein